MTDITKLMIAQKKLEQTVYTDVLTGLLNRRRFMEIMEEYLAKDDGLPKYALIMDLDHFKGINDTYGHLAGDEALKAVAKRIKETLRDDDCVARYGGEEFIVIPNAKTPDIVRSIAQRIRESVSASPVTYEGKKIPVTISIGAAGCYAKDKDGVKITSDRVIAKADEALYSAKENGRNCVYESFDL